MPGKGKEFDRQEQSDRALLQSSQTGIDIKDSGGLDMPRTLEPKKPYVSVSVTVSLKNKPKDYAGWTSRTFRVGLDEDVLLWHLIAGTVGGITEFYRDAMNKSGKEIKHNLKMAAAEILREAERINDDWNSKGGETNANDL
jgi:hypothetical protein